MSMKERRSFTRWNCAMPVDIDDYEQVYGGHLKNLGKGGAFVAGVSGETPEVGREVLLTIPFCQGAEFLIIRGRVVWVRDNGVGVTFLGYRNPIRRRLKRENNEVPVTERYRSK